MKRASALSKSENRRICLLLLHIAVVAGIIIGAIISPEPEKLSGKWWLHQYISPIYSGETVFEVFRNSFLMWTGFLGTAFILGFFAVGQPLSIALAVFRGVGIGASVCAMYMQSGAEIIPAVIVLVLPRAMITAFVTSIGIRETVKLQNTQFSFLLKGEQGENRSGKGMKLYMIKFAVLIGAGMLASIMDSVMNSLFTDLYITGGR